MLIYSAVRLFANNTPVLGVIECCAILGILFGTMYACIIMIQYVCLEGGGIMCVLRVVRSGVLYMVWQWQWQWQSVAVEVAVAVAVAVEVTPVAVALWQ